jgi:diguanylate cyclase (GGDEF)-like protein/PAS domain S-box-containing protein
MFQQIRALTQTATYLGLVMIAIVWGGVFHLIKEEREHATESALRQGSNLTRVFEEYIARVIKGADASLLVLRDVYESDPMKFEFQRWANGAGLQNDLLIQFILAGADGYATQSSLTPLPAPIDVSDRDYFQFHAGSTSDALYVGQPVIGRVSNKATIQLARRLRAPAGSFGGVVVASLDIEGIERFYNSIDVGPGGVITLVGLDGIIRARSGSTPQAREMIGRSLAQSKVFELVRNAPVGNYWNFQSPVGAADGVNRLISYRAVEGLPLIAIVGLSESDIFKQAWVEARKYYMIGLGLTTLVLIVMVFGAIRKSKLNSAAAELADSKRSLEQTNKRFDAAIENMAHGLCMFDRDQRVIVCNKRYSEMYGLTPEQTKPGTMLRMILEARVASGYAPEDGENYIKRGLTEVTRPKHFYIETTLRNGRTYAINHQPIREGGWVAIHEDRTEIRKAEANAEMAQRELIMQRQAVDQAMIVSVSDAKGRITFVNDNFSRISGYAREELIGKNHRIFRSGVHSDEFYYDMHNRIWTGEIWRGEVCNKAKNGNLFWLDTTIAPRLGEDGNLAGHIAIRVDITARKRAEKQIAYMAKHDVLTGLANRAVLLEKMEEALARLRRNGEAFAIFILDLDLFKVVNDSLGHPIGDELLKAVAHRLSACMGKGDTVARLGGDEFAILAMVDGDWKKSAMATAGRLLESVATSYDLDGHSVDIATSIGIALAPEHGTDVDELMKSADLALYKAKSQGRNAFSVFEATMGVEANARRALEIDLRNALTHGNFELHYHPIVDIRTQDIVGVEALVRWQHPIRGRIAPDDFISLAEETGLINQLGAWVLHRACADAASWPAHIKVAVNLSPAQFRKGNLLETIVGVLTETGLSPERLELEITESVLMQGNDENVGTLHELRRLGISVVLDDFGTGYSSLSYLRTFPFGKLKIDRSFVNELSKNADCAAIVSSIAGLGRSLHMDTVAEGIETSDQLALVRAAGCTHVQGFLFGRPCPASELQFTLRRHWERREEYVA